MDAPPPEKPQWQLEEKSTEPLAPQLDMLIGLLLDRIDENGDGIVTRQELKARAAAAKHERSRRVSTFDRGTSENRSERIRRQNTSIKRKSSMRRTSCKALPESFPLPSLLGTG